MVKSDFSCWRASWFSLVFVFERFAFQNSWPRVARVFCPFKGIVRSSLTCSLVFFRLAALNLRVDSCMFEMRFLMLAERLALGIPLPFFWEQLA
jgi:hypothetical protein